MSIIKTKCFKFENGKWKEDEIFLPQEVKLALYLNNKKFVNILCTPVDVEDLIAGFLYAENLIKKFDEVEKIEVSENRIDIILKHEVSIPEEKEKTYTSGFGKGIMFQVEGKKVNSDFKIEPEKIIKLMQEFTEKMQIYKISGAVHASCLADENKVITVKEDIGRHNTFDKIAGECLRKDIPTKDKIIFTTGRISTEMLLKSSKMEVPVVVTMKSPTSNTVKVADELGIAVVGKVKANSLVVFANKDRMIN